MVTLGFSILNYVLPGSLIDTYQTNYSASYPRRQLPQEATVRTIIMLFAAGADISVPAQLTDEAPFM